MLSELKKNETFQVSRLGEQITHIIQRIDIIYRYRYPTKKSQVKYWYIQFHKNTNTLYKTIS